MSYDTPQSHQQWEVPCYKGSRLLADSFGGLEALLKLRGHQDQVTLWDLVVPVDLLELVRKARETKVHRGQKLRVDTTVIESDIHHPTGAGLLADGVRMITPRG